MEMCGFTKTSIEPCDIFKSASGKPQPIRMLLTIGFAGIGKTFLVRKFVLDWASRKTNKDVDFIFPFTFRELNLEKGKKYSLAELIRHSISETKPMSEEMLDNIFVKLQESGKLDYESSSIKILFVLDGLDECRLKLDLTNKTKVDLDVTKAYPVEVLLSHLIKKNLLPCARVWITTRPATAHDIPPYLINSITEVQGFSDSQRLDYFRKRFKDEDIIKHIQKSRTIFIMCHLPIFCWLTSTVLQYYSNTGKERELPQTLTELYTAFLLHHLDKSKERQTKKSIKYVKALAKLAFDHLMKKSHIFSEKDLQKSGFDYFGAAKHFGMFTEVFKEIQPLKKKQQCKMFQFIHLTIQEYLAALYVMMSLFHDKKNVLADSELSLESLLMLCKKKPITQVHETAIHKASKSDGNLDLFLRFLLGLSLQTNQDLLGELLKAPKDSGRSNSETVLLIMNRIEQNSPEKNINLFYCLNEMKDDSLLEQIQRYLNSGQFFTERPPLAMWSALVFFLLTSDEAMNCFDLQRYSASVVGFLMLLPVIKASQKSLLNDCKLNKKSYEMLASVLSSPSNLRDLDLSGNDLYDDGVEILSAGLAKPHCILQVLRLSGCMITTPGCVSLAKALKLNPSHLQVLDLSYNNPGEEGKRVLTEVQMDPSTSLKTLNLDCSGIERLIPGLKKYFCSPTLDPNTAHNCLQLSDHCKTVTVVLEEQQYLLSPQRFTCWRQVLCNNGLSGRCYWEVDLEGKVYIAVTCDSIRRIGEGDDVCLGATEASWVLLCNEDGTYSARHQDRTTNLEVRSSRASRRVGVFLDHPRGKLSFYKVTSEGMILLHNYYSTFTQPLYPAFGFGFDNGFDGFGDSVSISVASESIYTHDGLEEEEEEEEEDALCRITVAHSALERKMALDAESKELLRETLDELGKDSFKDFKFYTHLPKSIHENADRVDIVEELVKRYSETALEETVKILEKIKECNLAGKLRSDIEARERDKSNAEGRRTEACGLNRESSISSADKDQITKLKGKLQENLRSNYINAPEGDTKLSRQLRLEDVYTDIHITHGSDAIPNKQHEVLQMEMCGFTKKSIEPCDIFKSASGKPQPIRMLLTIGFAGIGKTFLVRKFVLDWASRKTNKDVDFIFPFTFRELNLEKGKPFSLAELIRHSISENKAMSVEMLDNIFGRLQASGKLDYESSSIKILFVLDGLDECSLKLDLTNKTKVDLDVTKAYPVEVLLSHLIKKNLLPCARVWITTRPATAHDIPPDLINSITEVQGFSDSQRLDYFRKRFPDKEDIIKHIQKSRTIFIMCHLPIFCWLTSTVLQDHLDTGKEGELPQTLTELYTEFLLFHLDKSKERETKESIMYVKALAKLAFDHLLKKSHIFSETDLQKSGFDYFGAAKHSGMFTEVFKEVQPLKKNQQCKMFQFIHLTIQEYLAALYVMMSLFHDKKNVLADSERSLKSLFMTKKKLIVQVHETAIHKASKSDGNLDLFLRFLLGLSLQSNQDLLGKLLKAPKDSGRSNSETVLLIRKRMEQNSPEKNINLFYCLKEMKDDSLLETIQIYLNSGPFFMESLSPAMWSALVFFLLTSDEAMNCFDLQRCCGSGEGFAMLLPVIKASQKSLLNNCELNKKSCEMLASVLSSPSNLRDLDLSDNDLYDDGVGILSAVLAKKHCILQVLRNGGVMKGGRKTRRVGKVQTSQRKSRRDQPFTEVFKEVQPLKKNRKCKMFQFIHLTIQEYLAALYVMMSFFHDKKNVLADSERSLKSLFMTKKKLIIQVHETAIQKASKSDGNLDLFLRFLLGLSLQSNQDLLGELLKAPKDSGRSNSETVLLIEKRMEQNSPEKNINTFYCLKEMKDDSLLEQIQRYLNSGRYFSGSLPLAIWSELVFFLLTSDEAMNCFDLQRYSASGEGFAMLLPVIKASQKSLLSNCHLNTTSCEMLASVLSSPSNLRDLDLSDNDLYDDGVGILSAGLAKPHCILQVLTLSGCMITTPGSVSLAEALKLNPSHLQVLDLSYNNPGEEGERVLTEVQMDPSTSLKTLNLDCSGIERLIPGLKKYFCSPTLDPNTAHNCLQLSDHCKTVTVVREEQQYPLNPQRFTRWRQVLCNNELSGRCYWEVDLEGKVYIAVTYGSIRRIGDAYAACLGLTEASSVLLCNKDGTYSVHNPSRTSCLDVHPSPASRRVGVFLDHPRGKLSFYKVTPEGMILIHSYYSTFTKPLYPAFGFGSDHRFDGFGDSVSISVESEPTFTHPPLR
ncbi:uncharacterized protein LOC144034841 [Vanacampus margaritifer]